MPIIVPATQGTPDLSNGAPLLGFSGDGEPTGQPVVTGWQPMRPARVIPMPQPVDSVPGDPVEKAARYDALVAQAFAETTARHARDMNHPSVADYLDAIRPIWKAYYGPTA